MYTSCVFGKYLGKMNNFQGGLEFKIKYHFKIEQGGGGCRPLRGEWMFFRKDEQTRGKEMGDISSLWQSLPECGTSSLLSCDKSQSFLVAKTPREGISDKWLYLGETADNGGSEKASPCICYFSSACSSK